MSSEYIQVKVYLEGIEIPVNTVSVTSGDFVQAAIRLTYHNKYTSQFKPGTLVHIFIFYGGKWIVFFAGKLINIIFSDNDTHIRATSLFGELNQAKISPLNMQESAYGHAIPFLNVSAADKIYHKKTDTEVYAFTSDKVEFFNMEYLEKSGSLPEYIQGLLQAARYISPWYRIQSDTMRLNQGYYALDNPNIYPITQKTSTHKLVNNALSNFGNQLSYNQVILLLLKQLRYIRYELNTPIKLDGEWKWVILLPDPTYLPPFKTETIDDSKFVSFEMEETENYTRMLMRPINTDSLLNIVKNAGVEFLYAHGGEQPYIKKDGKYSIKFTDEEKYSGVRPAYINLQDEDLIYMLTDWEKSDISKLRSDQSTISIREESEKYIKEIADYEYTKLQNAAIQGISLIPVYNLELLPMFPIRIDMFDDFKIDIPIRRLIYSFNAEGEVSINVTPDTIMNSSERSSLRWDPDEYKKDNLDKFYDQFRNRELMTENQYWTHIGLGKGKRWRKASNLNATVVAQLPIEEDLLTEYLFTPLVYERAVPVALYYKEIFGIELELKAPDGSIIDLNLYEQEMGPIISAGRDKIDVSKKEKIEKETEPILESLDKIKGGYEEFRKAIQMGEGRKDQFVVNQYGYMGLYQFGKPRLWDLGYSIDGYTGDKKRDNYVYITKREFLTDVSIQHEAFRRHVYDPKVGYFTMVRKRYSKYFGTVGLKNITITSSGCVAVLHLKGLGEDSGPKKWGLHQYLTQGKDGHDANFTYASKYMRKYGGYVL